MIFSSARVHYTLGTSLDCQKWQLKKRTCLRLDIPHAGYNIIIEIGMITTVW